MMYMTFAALFIAQSYNIDLFLGVQISMLLVLMLTSKGMAGVPKASLVIIGDTLNTFKSPKQNLPVAGNRSFAGYGKSATIVAGNSVAITVVRK